MKFREVNRKFENDEIALWDDRSQPDVDVKVRILSCVDDDPLGPFYRIQLVRDHTYTHTFEKDLSPIEK